MAGTKSFVNLARLRVLFGWTLGGASFDDNEFAHCGPYFSAFLKNSITGRS